MKVNILLKEHVKQRKKRHKSRILKMQLAKEKTRKIKQGNKKKKMEVNYTIFFEDKH
jgi:hypothetical protein